MPGFTLALNVLEIIRYVLITLCITVAQAAVFAVIAFGYVAAAIAVLLGPVFIPFFIVPHMEWLFWGWLKSLIQYAFYPVVANAYVFVFGQVLIHFVDANQPPYNGAGILVLFFPLVLLLIAFTYGILGGFPHSSIRYSPAVRENRRCRAYLSSLYLSAFNHAARGEDLNAAGRQYGEQFGSMVVTNTYLKIALLASSLVNIALVTLALKTYEAFRDLNLLVIRINRVGRRRRFATTVSNTSRKSPNLNIFSPTLWSAATAACEPPCGKFPPARFISLDGRLADALMEANKKSKAFEMFLGGFRRGG